MQLSPRINALGISLFGFPSLPSPDCQIMILITCSSLPRLTSGITGQAINKYSCPRIPSPAQEPLILILKLRCCAHLSAFPVPGCRKYLYSQKYYDQAKRWIGSQEGNYMSIRETKKGQVKAIRQRTSRRSQESGDLQALKVRSMMGGYNHSPANIYETFIMFLAPWLWSLIS